jgi:hypothetical protein
MKRPLLAISLATTLIALPACAKTSSNAVGAPPPEKIGVLVFDDFTSNPDETVTQRIERMGKRYQPNDNCEYVGQQANDVWATGGGSLVPGLSHGEGVYQDLHDELSGVLGSSPVPPPPPPAPDPVQDVTDALRATTVHLQPGHVELWDAAGNSIYLIGIDTADFTTTQIRDDLKTSLDTLKNKLGFTGFVANNSWVAYPCDVVSWLNAATDPSGHVDQRKLLEAYKAVIDNSPDLRDLEETIDKLVGAATTAPVYSLAVPGYPELGKLEGSVAVNLFYRNHDQRFLGWTNENPLGVFVGGTADSYRLIPVAAAGNGIQVPVPRTGGRQTIKVRWPFAPAQWNSFVSVSSIGDDVDGLAEYSNYGEIRLDGDYNGGRGTSYAAPRLSAHLAVFLSNGGPNKCAWNVVPVLGYATQADLNSNNLSAWKNQDYIVPTFSTYCAPYEPYFPLP